MAAQHQGLIHRLNESPVPLLDVAVFVRAVRIGFARLQAVVPQQSVVRLGEVLRVLQLMHRRTQAVGLMGAGHAAQPPQRLLQTAAERLQAFGEADLHRFPVGVGQREVVDQVLEGLSLEGHTQPRHVGEVRLTQLTRLVPLREVDFLGGPFQRPPQLDAPLQRTQLCILILARALALQVLKEGLGLQSRVELEGLLDLRPHLHEGIGPVTPGVRYLDLAG